jgi:hypothetical protein
MAGKAKVKAATSRVHSVRWTAEEWKQLQAKAKSMTAELPLPVEPVDVIRIAVKAYLDGGAK